jgi:hypothetical protein
VKDVLPIPERKAEEWKRTLYKLGLKIIKVLSGLRMGLRGGVRPRIVAQAQSINKQLLLPFKASRNS